MRAVLATIAPASLACLLLIASGCDAPPEGWTPVLEQTSTEFLQGETEDAATHLREARALLAPVEATEDAVEEIVAAEDALQRLLTYYLPLLEARERAYNAYRHYYLGETERTAEELDEVEAILLAIAGGDRGHLLREFEDPLERLEDARASVETGSGQAPDALQALARELNLLLVRGGLVLAND